nr:DUF4345 domain-containing protein [uncultured Cohaesibacter sp.]
MPLTLFQKLALGLAGLTAVGIGFTITAIPHMFYTSYGIALGPDASLLSELRAPGAGLTAFGIIMLLGIVKQSYATIAIVAAQTVFLAFPAGRLVSLAIDGMPSEGILAALAFELVIAVLCLLAFLPKRRRQQNQSQAA